MCSSKADEIKNRDTIKADEPKPESALQRYNQCKFNRIKHVTSILFVFNSIYKFS